jgi:hypothetical protein
MFGESTSNHGMQTSAVRTVVAGKRDSADARMSPRLGNERAGMR